MLPSHQVIQTGPVCAGSTRPASARLPMPTVALIGAASPMQIMANRADREFHALAKERLAGQSRGGGLSELGLGRLP